MSRFDLLETRLKDSADSFLAAVLGQILDLTGRSITTFSGSGTAP